MRFSLTASLIIILCLWALPVYGQWPEHGMVILTSVSENIDWAEKRAEPQFKVLEALVPRLSRELGVPVSLHARPDGQGILAANIIAGARPDAYLMGALEPDPALTLTIQGYTPYIWGEFVPVASGWRQVYALIVRADYPAADLRDLAAKSGTMQPRLAHTGRKPADTALLLGLETAKAAGFSWQLQQVARMDPGLLLEGKADVMIMPLGYLKIHPDKERLKVLTILDNGNTLNCMEGVPNLKSQNLELIPPPVFAFYLPDKVNWKVRSRLSTAINSALRNKAVGELLKEACLIGYFEDLEGVGPVMNKQYEEQEALLRKNRMSTGLIESEQK